MIAPFRRVAACSTKFISRITKRGFLGRQVGFYATQDDIDALVAESRKRGAVVIAQMSARPEPTIYADGLPTFRGPLHSDDQSRVSAALVRLHDVDRLKWWHNPNFGYWEINDARELVVQFLGPLVKGKTMSAGRLWYSPEESVRKNKPEDFLKWAESLLRIPRKLFPKAPRPESYSYTQHVGPGAAAMAKSGQILFDDAHFMPK